MKIKDILQLKGSEIISLLPDTVIPGAALMLAKQSIGAAVVQDPEKGVMGVISERDISRGLGEHGAKVLEMQVSDFMSDDVITCSMDWDVSAALELMLTRNIRHLPVIGDDFSLVGMVSMRDVAAMA